MLIMDQRTFSFTDVADPPKPLSKPRRFDHKATYHDM